MRSNIQTFIVLILALSIAEANDWPVFRITDLSQESIAASRNDLINKVHPYEAILLRKAFRLFHETATDQGTMDVWKLLDGKSALEIYQHAVIVKDRMNREEIITIKEKLLEHYKNVRNKEELSGQEKLYLDDMIRDELRALKEAQLIGVPLLSSASYESDKRTLRSSSQSRLIQGKWYSLLCDTIEDCDRIEIISTDFGSTCPGMLLHSIAGNYKVKEFLSVFSINEERSGGLCFCSGDALLAFYQEDTKIAEISYHHGHSLRWNDGPWVGIAAINRKEQIPLLEWFTANGFDSFEKVNRDRIAQQVAAADGTIAPSVATVP
jgi:hypothetical protein